MDHAVLLLLRLVHVVGGVLWTGHMVLLAWFVLPTQALEGAEGGRFVQRMMIERRLSAWLNFVGALTGISGIILYTRATMGTDGAFARSHAGMVLGFGGLVAILAAIIGGAMGGGASRGIGAIRTRLAAEGRAPTAAEGAEIGRLAQRGALAAKITSILLLVAAAAMAVGRYS